MSHFTSVKTKIKNLACLIRALKDLNYEFVQAEEHQTVQVRGYQGQKTDAVMCIKASKTYDIGVKLNKETGTYEFVADWWGVETTRGVTEEEFIKQLTRRYSYHVVKQEIEKKGWQVEEEEQGEQIHIKVGTWS
ncbi:MAG: DUF1257 domain-containing protein [Deltaproteobacteria bacterium]|nr:DUF1257 domain-containing protein [Deltaproteobacteria bacterium]